MSDERDPINEQVLAILRPFAWYHALDGGQQLKIEMSIAAALRTAHKVPEGCVEAARVLAKIADAYDDNGLDDEARKFWGKNDEHHNTTPPEHIELYDGRGGRCLLTLADCLNARAALAARGEGK